jgi:hypothetical protein
MRKSATAKETARNKAKDKRPKRDPIRDLEVSDRERSVKGGKGLAPPC